ncbi:MULTISPECIES: glutathione S-transferase family protein [Ramlibacter]|uniref:Glutathione S-transferase family protein n=1 Tax=Ramlibacter pinisoli TaxID=2682844 RepID=A0A6N8J0C0_9BURK|nr:MULTISPECIES: glutathione S-transferase family protein [Ramlibacter]MBA2962605.1 glutathione S-transferase family protein [Ramlibacter sp. CGMCC 1.13660]MVQ32547.1 glutathione S-transferase family protein [Ramlibacter pinisoli]
MSGYLDHGQWRDGWYDTRPTQGEFVRTTSAFRHWITSDPSAVFHAEAGRYHLYVSLACPWAHRTLIARMLKGLQDVITVSVVEPVMTQGWCFSDALPDHLHGSRYLHQLYAAADPGYTGRVLVPALWDRKTGTIVSNESSEILRMFNSAFAGLAQGDVDLYPAALRDAIDRVNAFVYDNINNGVYRCGFATEQGAYERAFERLFSALDWVEGELGEGPFLVGDRPTEADWRLFTTLVRFDAVYFSHFKCNRNRIEDFPHLSRYLRTLYRVPGIAATVDFDHIKRHYYMSHPHINPTRIVPVGPRLRWDEGS